MDLPSGLPLNIEPYQKVARQASRRESKLSAYQLYYSKWLQINLALLQELNLQEEVALFYTQAGLYPRLQPAPSSSKSSARSTPFYYQNFFHIPAPKKDLSASTLEEVLSATLSSAISGMSITYSNLDWHDYCCDNGSLDASKAENTELRMRWLETLAFMPIFHVNIDGFFPAGMDYGAKLPEENISRDSSLAQLNFLLRFAKIYQSLKPYRKKVIAEAIQRGRPVLRPLILHYPEDPELDKLSHNLQLQQFMLGSEILIAPIFRPKQEERKVYLPAGEWVHLWREESYASTERVDYLRGTFRATMRFFQAWLYRRRSLSEKPREQESTITF